MESTQTCDLLTILNVDTLLSLATFLCNHDLQHSLARVCRLLYAVATSEIVWAQILVRPCCLRELEVLVDRHPRISYVDCTLLSSFEASRCVPALQSLEFLKFVDCGYTGHWNQHHNLPLLSARRRDVALGAGGRLRELELYYGGVHDTRELLSVCTGVTALTVQENHMLIPLVNKLPNLASLTICTPTVAAEHLFPVLECHTALTALSYISVLPRDAQVNNNNVYGISDTRLNERMWAYPPTLPQLCELCVINDESQFDLHLLAGTEVVVSVELHEAREGHFVELSKKPSLTSLSVNTLVDSDGLRDAVDVFASSSNLRHIDGRLRGSVRAAFVASLACATRLRGQWACDDVISSLGMQLDSLRCLTLSEPLSDDNCAAIGTYATRLHCLNIEFATTVSESGAEKLAGACASLRALQLSSSRTVAIAKAAAQNGVCDDVEFANDDGACVAAFFDNCAPRRILIASLFCRIERMDPVFEFAARGGSIDFLITNAGSSERFCGVTSCGYPGR